MTRFVADILPSDLGMSIVFSFYLAGGLSDNFLRSPKIVSQSIIFYPASLLLTRIFLMSSLAKSALEMAYLVCVKRLLLED